MELTPKQAPPAVRIAVRGLTIDYPGNSDAERYTALEDVSLDVHQGEFLCVVGPSGCGKTTLLNILAGFLKPSEGKITFDQSISKNTLENDIGIVFQEYALFPWRTSIENVMFGLEMKGLSLEESKKIAHQYLELVHLGHAANIYPHQLSGGMRQRVAVARALVGRPKLILADEPTAALDKVSCLEVINMLKEWANEYGSAVVVVTHDNRILDSADRIVKMVDGAIISDVVLEEAIQI